MLWPLHAGRDPLVLPVIYHRVCVGAHRTLATHGRLVSFPCISQHTSPSRLEVSLIQSAMDWISAI